MKKNGAAPALLTPDAHGWRIFQKGAPSQTAGTLGEAAALIPAGCQIHLALPCHRALLERLTFPSTNREELAGMVQLQLEKTLPFPIEEITSDFQVIRQDENESTLLSIAAHRTQIEELCQPLRDRSRIPQKLTLFASHVAAGCPEDQVVFCLWQEEDQLVGAICEQRKLGAAYLLPGTDAESLLREIPSMMLQAEMEGVPTEFDGIRIERSCEHLAPALTGYLGKPVEIVTWDRPLPDAAIDLVPDTWRAESRRLEKSGKLKQRLQAGAFVYLLLVAGAFLYLAWMKMQVRKLDQQLAETGPQIEFVQARQARWEALAPAIHPNRYAVEILDRLVKSLPTSDVKITDFQFTPTSFRLAGEAPDYDVASRFGDELKKPETGLGDFEIATPQPEVLKATNLWRFNYSGKRR
ncbi:MAG: pilus assembly protein PilM [Verrucomicrobiota bacterium]|nr:pilus assembly protein PilM [Verrucomicrobiota bacterium]